MTKYQVLKRQKPWRDAYYYQKSETLYQMTYVFCQRFLPAHGDRTVDQMVQAARFIKNFDKYTTNEAGKALVAAGPKL